MGVELSFWKLIILTMGCWIGPSIVITSNQIQSIDPLSFYGSKVVVTILDHPTNFVQTSCVGF